MPTPNQMSADGIKTDWIKDYHVPDLHPNHPGKDGGSVADPMGNCTRCGAPVHHEKIIEHVKSHLGLGDKGVVSHAAQRTSRNEVGFRAPGRHAK